MVSANNMPIQQREDIGYPSETKFPDLSKHELPPPPPREVYVIETRIDMRRKTAVRVIREKVL